MEIKRLIGRTVYVELEIQEQMKTDSGLFVSADVYKEQNGDNLWGRVLASTIPEVPEGSRVLFSRFSGAEVDEKHRIIEEEALLVVEE